MTISADPAGVIKGYQPQPARLAAAGRDAASLRCRSVQPSRRALLHVQAPGDPPVPAELMSWFTERAFHFYLAAVSLPGRGAAAGLRAPSSLRAGWRQERVFADLDAARAQLRYSAGMDNVIVTARGDAALAVASWSNARQLAAADAVILYAPELPWLRSARLDIGCPVLVLSPADGRAAGSGARALWHVRAAHLGGHVTSVQLRCWDGRSFLPGGPALHEVFGELGRWLGAYMYGRSRDRLL